MACVYYMILAALGFIAGALLYEATVGKRRHRAQLRRIDQSYGFNRLRPLPGEEG